jgi:hypothetical protein
MSIITIEVACLNSMTLGVTELSIAWINSCSQSLRYDRFRSAESLLLQSGVPTVTRWR